AHDYPTDVLSFPLVDEPPHLVGEVIVSADTAITSAAEYGWPAEHELLLYVVHGVLHLAGRRDKTEEESATMRADEARYLRLVGVEAPAPPPATPGGSS
ncbi:MAG: rRNA maturation RNase YbeY, partial [Planctomycetota bacterium]